MTRAHTCAPIAVRLTSVALFFAVAIAPVRAMAQPVMPGTAADRDGVRRAVLDYVEGFYEGDSAKLARSIRPEVYKYGFWKARDSTRYAGERMAWPEFLSYARGVKQNNRQAPATAPKRVELFEVQDQTAVAKVTAFWGTDYLLLGKYDGKWMISSVMWQGPLPRPAPKGSGDDGGEAEESAVEPFNNDLFATDNVYRGTFAPDGRTFFFFRKVAQNPQDEDYRIFESRLFRRGSGWSEPQPLRGGVNSGATENFAMVSADMTQLVFVRDFSGFYRADLSKVLPR